MLEDKVSELTKKAVQFQEQVSELVSAKSSAGLLE